MWRSKRTWVGLKWEGEVLLVKKVWTELELWKDIIEHIWGYDSYQLETRFTARGERQLR